jgi:hypothetical protein
MSISCTYCRTVSESSKDGRCSYCGAAVEIQNAPHAVPTLDRSARLKRPLSRSVVGCSPPASMRRARLVASASQLPSITDLTEATGLAVGTVRRAIDILVQEGLVQTVPGRGTFVRR